MASPSPVKKPRRARVVLMWTTAGDAFPNSSMVDSSSGACLPRIALAGGKRNSAMFRPKPGMALVLALLMTVVVGCARKGEGRRPAPPQSGPETVHPAGPDAFDVFLSELLLEENGAAVW